MFLHLSVILFTGGGGGVHGKGGASVRGKGRHAWQERRPLQRTIRILLECILVGHPFIMLLPSQASTKELLTVIYFEKTQKPTES